MSLRSYLSAAKNTAVRTTPRHESAHSGPASRRAGGLIADPTGDILPTYTGVQLPGMDVVAHEVRLMGDRLEFFGRMAGPIAPTQDIGGLYLFGLDRGQGTPASWARRPRLKSGPTCCGTRVIRINPDGTGLFNNQLDRCSDSTKHG